MQRPAPGLSAHPGPHPLTSDADIANAERNQPAVLVLFDLLRDGKEDLRGVPLAARRLRLQERIRPRGAERDVIWLSEIALDDGRPMLQRARSEGWEGLIVKNAQSTYHSGKRTPAWRKLKLLKQQEFVVGGWTEPRQSRQHFGSLLVGYYDDGGALRWAGRVGTGFDQEELDRVARLLQARAIAASPFADTFKTGEPAHWVRPTWWSRSGSRSGRATGCFGSRCISARATTRRHATSPRRREANREAGRACTERVPEAPSRLGGRAESQNRPA